MTSNLRRVASIVAAGTVALSTLGLTACGSSSDGGSGNGDLASAADSSLPSSVSPSDLKAAGGAALPEGLTTLGDIPVVRPDTTSPSWLEGASQGDKPGTLKVDFDSYGDIVQRCTGNPNFESIRQTEEGDTSRPYGNYYHVTDKANNLNGVVVVFRAGSKPDGVVIRTTPLHEDMRSADVKTFTLNPDTKAFFVSASDVGNDVTGQHDAFLACAADR